MQSVEEFLASSRFADTTKTTYRPLLTELVKHRDLATWSAARLVSFVERDTWGNSRRRLALFACQSYLRWRFGTDHAGLGARIKREEGKRQRALDPAMALKLLALFDTSHVKGARDLALSALFLDAGLRVSEMCRLRTADVDLESRTLQVLAKGGKWRFATYSPETAQYISEWLAFRDRRGTFETLFVSTRKWTPLVPEGLNRIVSEWGKQLGIALSPHDLRRSSATLKVIFGSPSRIVQVDMGWDDPAMLVRYTRTLEAQAIAPYLPVSNLLARRSGS